MKLPVLLLGFLALTTHGSPVTEFLSLQHEADISTINPCKDKELLSCIPTSVDFKKLGQDTIVLPGGLTLNQKKTFQEGKTSFAVYADDMENEAFFSYRNNRMMGKVSMSDNTMFFVEPCNNWEGCHVWKKISQDSFVDETHVVSPHEDKLSEIELRKIEELRNKGKNDNTATAEFTMMFYYTRDFAANTDDIELFMDTIIGDMNLGYENSDIPIRARLHCVEAAALDDLSESSDMLHAFDAYKPSPAAIRETADAAQLLANDFHNCGSGYTYTATGHSGHTLSVVKKSCSFGYHSSIHEVGHNFGCQHDKGTSTNSHYDYGYGWFIGPENLGGRGYRTAMAYTHDGHKNRVNYLSNPNVDYQGYPTGDAQSADNARVVTENRFLMAAFGDESQACNAV